MRQKILFIHQNLPGQFRHLLLSLSRREDIELRAIGDRTNVSPGLSKALGVAVDTYEFSAAPVNNRFGSLDHSIGRGLCVASLLRAMKFEGFVPDLIYVHPGWGEALFVRDVFPTSRIATYCEFYYRVHGADVGFDPEFSAEEDAGLTTRVRNMPLLSSLEASDIGIAPTAWQRSLFPAGFREQIGVVHDGIDSDTIHPAGGVSLRMHRDGSVFTQNDEIVTYVARNLEPYRGFHVFMRSLPMLLRRRPKAHVIIVGADGVSYGQRSGEGGYKAKYLEEIRGDVDMSRLHFVGKLPTSVYRQVLQVSTVHVYLTYPFVLSWSLLEAMSAGCFVIGSDTAPVKEVIDGTNGWLVDFFSPEDLASKVSIACENRVDLMSFRARARETIVERYDLRRVTLPRQLELLGL
jgi:glycosyltransferase involved in cell wall biosynthesis